MTETSFAVTVASPMRAFVVLSKRFTPTVASTATDFAGPPAAAIAILSARAFALTSADFSDVTTAPSSI